MGETPDSGNILLRMRSRVDFPELHPLQERPERQEKRSGYSIAAERWGRAKWLIALRRLAKDYEYRVQTAETLISIAAIRLMLNRIAPA